MKNPGKIATMRKGILFVGSIILLLGCSNGDDPSPAAQESCRLVSETTTTTGPSSPGVTFTNTQTHTASYDGRGNRISESLTNNYAFSDGKVHRRSSSYNYQYDANDFVLRILVQQSETDAAGSTTMQSTDNSYEYDKGRVVKYISVSTANGTSATSTLQFEYDGQGRLIKLTNTTNNSYSKFEYIGDHAYKITRVDMNGNSTSPFIEFNGAGLIVKSITTQEGSTTEWRYEYNADGLQTRSELYYDGKPHRAEDFEYDNKDHPYTKGFAPAKGLPIIPAQGPAPNYRHNVTRSTNYSGNPANGQWELKEDIHYTYEYNSKNLPTSVTSETVDKNGAEISTGTIELEYQDCQ
jgi:YD repeat-containing protein